jgi:hypothetical protein
MAAKLPGENDTHMKAIVLKMQALDEQTDRLKTRGDDEVLVEVRVVATTLTWLT